MSTSLSSSSSVDVFAAWLWEGDEGDASGADGVGRYEAAARSLAHNTRKMVLHGSDGSDGSVP